MFEDFRSYKSRIPESDLRRKRVPEKSKKFRWSFCSDFISYGIAHVFEISKNHICLQLQLIKNKADKEPGTQI